MKKRKFRSATNPVGGLEVSGVGVFQRAPVFGAVDDIDASNQYLSPASSAGCKMDVPVTILADDEGTDIEMVSSAPPGVLLVSDAMVKLTVVGVPVDSMGTLNAAYSQPSPCMRMMNRLIP